MQVTIRLNKEQVGYLSTLGGVACGTTVEDVINHLIDAAVDGARRPGSWERQWLIQCFSSEFESKLKQHPTTHWHQVPK